MYTNGSHGPVKAAVLDVDETVATGNSWTTLTSALGVSVPAHLALYQDVVAGNMDEPGASAALVKLWNSSGHANRDSLQSILSRIPLHDDALGLAHWFHHRNIEVWLISGSVDVYVRAVAKALRAQQWQANSRLVFGDNGDLLGLIYQVNQEALKRSQLIRLCQDNGIDPSETVAIGDGKNDIELFNLTGRGILLDRNGDRARYYSKAWRIATTLNEVPSILIEAGLVMKT
jgi:phosphoserine phosphatase